MPIQTYTGRFSEATGLNRSPSTYLNTSEQAYGAATEVTAVIGLSTTAYGNTYPVEVTINCSNGVSDTVTQNIKLDSSNYTQAYITVTGFDPAIIGINSVESIVLYCATNGGKIFAKGSQKVNVTYEEPTQGISPRCTVFPTAAAPGAEVRLSWLTGSPGIANTIIGYRIEESTNGSTWTELATVEGGVTSYTARANETKGAKKYFRIRIINGFDGSYSDPGAYAEVRTYTYTKASISSLQLWASIVEVSTNLHWSGLQAGSNSFVTALVLEYATSETGEFFSEYTSLIRVPNPSSSGSLVVYPTEERGHIKRFRAKAISSYSSEYDSDWVYSANLIKNNAPNTPTSVSVQEVYDPNEGLLTVSFSSGGDKDNNLARYSVGFCDPMTNDFYQIKAASSYTDNSLKVDATTLPRDFSWRIAVKGVDVFGIEGAWAYSASVLRVNSLQAVPTIVFPHSGAKTYNLRPRVGISIGGSNSNKVFSLALTYDNTERRTTGEGSAEFSQAGGGIPNGANILWQCGAEEGYGTKVLKNVLTNDGYSDIEASYRPAARQLTINSTGFTDPQLQRNVTLVKAAHITELRAAINTVEAYYGLPISSWRETLIPRKSFIRHSHISELRAAIERVVEYINGFDASNTVNDVPVFFWTDPDLSEQPIRAVHIEEIRDAILLL